MESENFEITGQMIVAKVVEGRIHVPSGAVLNLTGVAVDGVVDGPILEYAGRTVITPTATIRRPTRPGDRPGLRTPRAG